MRRLRWSLIAGLMFFLPSSAVSQARQADARLGVGEVIAAATIDRFMARLVASGGLPARVSGFDATRLNWRSENADWSAFVGTAPFRSAIGRDGGEHSGGDSRPNPAKRHRPCPAGRPARMAGVDKTAPLWAIRHYRPDNEGLDPTSPLTSVRRAANEPDLQAVGLAVTITGETSPQIAVHYYSGSPQALSIAQRFWDHPAEGLTSAVRGGPQSFGADFSRADSARGVDHLVARASGRPRTRDLPLTSTDRRQLVHDTATGNHRS